MTFGCRHCYVGVWRETGSFIAGGSDFYKVQCTYCSAEEFFEREPFKQRQWEAKRMSEPVTMTASVKKLNRARVELLDGYERECRENLEPFCSACFNYDYQKGLVQPREAYVKCCKFVEHKLSMNSRKESANYGEPIEAEMRFVCEKGHRICVASIPIKTWKEKFEGKKAEVKKKL